MHAVYVHEDNRNSGKISTLQGITCRVMNINNHLTSSHWDSKRLLFLVKSFRWGQRTDENIELIRMREGGQSFEANRYAADPPNQSSALVRLEH